MNPFGRRSIKRNIWSDISKKSEPVDLKKDWWLWLLVLGIVGALIFGR